MLLLRVIVASLSSLSRTGGLFLWCLGRFPLKSYFSELKEEEGTGCLLKPYSLRIYSSVVRSGIVTLEFFAVLKQLQFLGFSTVN